MKVSILIPCYNAQRWIRAAIRSALEQTHSDTEVIVVDDGSTDTSLDVIRSFGSSIRWETGPNRGGNVARNRLLDLASGEWLQYLDADDYLLPDKIAVQLADGSEAASADVIYSPFIKESWEQPSLVQQEVVSIPEPHDPWILLARWLLPQTGSPLWRRDALVDVGGWDPSLPCCQEHDLYCRLLQAGKTFHFCAYPGAVYRIWSDQTVCRKNPLETVRRQLNVIRNMELFLMAKGELNPARRDAIAHLFIESARTIYRLDKSEALAVHAQVEEKHPGFELPPASCFPWTYRFLYRAVGFEWAERLADMSRGWRAGNHGKIQSAANVESPDPELAFAPWELARIAAAR